MPVDPVIIDFNVRGLTDVSRAFETIQQRMARFEKQNEQGADRAAKARVKTTQTEAQQRERAYAKLVTSLERDEKRALAAAERAEKGKEKAAERAAQVETRLAKKKADDEIREAARAEREKDRLRRRSSEMAGRYYARQVAEEARASEQARRARGAALAQGVGRGIGNVTSTVGSLVGGALAFGGGFAVADAGRRQMDAQRAAALLVNSATIGGVAAPGATQANILAQASQVARETGVDKTDLIGAVQNYVAKSSDFTGGMENMRFFGRLSKASGTRLEDITGAAGILRAQNKNLSAADMRQMLLDLVEQGKQGAVEISDMAHLAGALGSTRGLYGGSQTDNQRKLLALAQLTRTESESPEEAATSVKDLGEQALKKANPKNGEAPVWLRNVTKGGVIQSPEALIEAALLGTGGDQGKLLQTFNAQGVKVFQRLAPIFKAAGGGEKGIAAVRAEMNPILNAKGSEQQLTQQFDEVMASDAAKFDAAINSIRETLETKLTPFLDRFAQKLPDITKSATSVIDTLGDVAKSLTDNPLQGLAAILSASIAKEVAVAQLGPLLQRLMATQVGASFASGIGIASAAFTIAEVGMMAIDHMAAEEVREQRETIADTNTGANAALDVFGKIRSGKVTAKDLTDIQAQTDALEAKKKQLEVAATPSPDVDFTTGEVVGQKRDLEAEGQLKNVNQALDLLHKAAEKATQALQKMGAEAANRPTPPPGPIGGAGAPR